jgi:hypothetical protein
VKLKIKNRKLSLVYILLIFTFLLIMQMNLIYAADLTVSQYELYFTLDYSQEMISDPVEINRTSLEADNRADNKNIYLDSFTLKNARGKEIPAHYIKIETPHLQGQELLDNRPRYLIMKKNQEKSWFKIGLAKAASFLEPGEYTETITIEGLDWEIKVTAVIKPFVRLSIEDNTFNFEIKEPFESDFFITDDLFKINVDYNHLNWEIKAHLEEFINGQGEKLAPRYLFYRLRKADRRIDINDLQKDQFSNFNKDEMIIMINGRDYDRGLKAIRFGVDLERENTTVQPSGLYNGKIIFTLRTLDNDL